MKTIKLTKNIVISEKDRAFIIAEIGSNHNNDLKLAKKMINEAKKCGADAVKFQTFKAKYHFSKYSPSFKFLKNKPMYKLIQDLELDRSWHKKLKNYCIKKKIIFFTSPCDYGAVDDLEKIGVPIYKIASFDITDIDLIKYIAKTKKPIILSTGLADFKDVFRAIKACEDSGNRKIILLECTSIYPAPESLMNLNSIVSMRKKFGVITGFSDHSLGDHMILASISLGAKVIEKHFTLNKKMKGPDHNFAMEPKEFKEMVIKIRKIESGLGDGIKKIKSKKELEMYNKGRRSIHVNKFLKKNDIIKKEDLIIKRPGYGIKPYKWKKVVGKKLLRSVKEDYWLTWQDIKIK